MATLKIWMVNVSEQNNKYCDSPPKKFRIKKSIDKLVYKFALKWKKNLEKCFDGEKILIFFKIYIF